MDTRRVAIYLARSRVGLGLLALLAPRAVSRLSLGPGASTPAAGALARMVGARDAVLGAGAAIAAGERRGGANWLSMCALVDGFDAAVMLLTPRLPLRSRLIGAVVGVSAVAHLALARELGAAEPTPTSGSAEA